MSLSSRVIPGVSKRTDFSLVGDKCALLVVDIQKYLSVPSSPEEAAEKAYFFNEACPSAIDKISKLAEAFRVVRDDPTGRKSGCEVIFTYLQSATKDGRDISVDYKLSGPDLANIPRIGTDHKELFLKELEPDIATGKGDILLPKTSCNVFVSTNIDYLLRNLGIEQVVIVGQLTDECVESAVRTAADLGYFVTVVEDACASLTPEKHQKGLNGVKGFARILKTADILDEILEGISISIESNSSHKMGPSSQVNDESVLAYLRSKGLNKVAKQLDMMFTIQAIAKRDKDKREEKKLSEDEKKDEELRPPRTPRRKAKHHHGERNNNNVDEPSTQAVNKEKDSDGSLTLDDLDGKDEKPIPARVSTPPPAADPPAGMPAPPFPKSPKKNKSKKVMDNETRVDSV